MKPEVSDEELRGYMNFNELLERRETAVKRIRNIDMIRKLGIISAAVVTLTVVWFNYRGGTASDVVQEPPAADAPAHRPDESIAPVQQDSVSAGSEPGPTPPPAARAEEKARGLTTDDAAAAAAEPRDNAPATRESGSVEYEYAEAEPVDGFAALYQYFGTELTYPPAAVPDSVQGVVTVSFVIGVSGEPEKIRIENSLGALFDEEVKRLIGNMPPWRPATVNGKPVPSRLSIPVTFQLEKVTKK